MSETEGIPVCIYATKERAKEAEGRARDEIAAVLKKHGAIGAIIVIGMIHREGSDTLMNVGVEGSGSVEHVNAMVADVMMPGLFGPGTHHHGGGR